MVVSERRQRPDLIPDKKARFMTGIQNPIDPVPESAYPAFGPAADAPPPPMPKAWSAVALLHPFSPPPAGPKPSSPFYQLCVATIEYRAGEMMSIQVVGCEYGAWWYVVGTSDTQLSTDHGETWTNVDLGWTLPDNWFGTREGDASCVGTSALNWMDGPVAEWWKVPVPLDNPPPAATWMWFDATSRAPIRMMFGYGPPSPEVGSADALAFFQMYSFANVPVFEASVPTGPPTWDPQPIPGFQVGNPGGFQNFVWNDNFGMTAFMTPVNEEFNPLPTRVLYVWKGDSDYHVASDRSQDTKMVYNYNKGNKAGLGVQVALLTGRAPEGVTPPVDSDEGFLINYYANDQPGPSLGPTCVGGSCFAFPQEPPDWVSIPGVEGRIQATITDNPVMCPGHVVTIFSVLFPPSPPNYPEATYLWTWYSPLDDTGLSSRPVTFMQSQSGVSAGTSLALADYFYYEDFASPIDPANFAVPSCCSPQTRKLGLRRRLP